MALGKSIKMYLTIFVATTCVYMVLYQYHISRQPLPSPELLKNKELEATSNEFEKTTSRGADLVRRYNLFLWSPISVLSNTQRQQLSQQQQQQQQQQENDNKTTGTTVKTVKTATTKIANSLNEKLNETPQSKSVPQHRHSNQQRSTIRKLHNGHNNNNNNYVVNDILSSNIEAGIAATSAGLAAITTTVSTTTTTTTKATTTTTTTTATKPLTLLSTNSSSIHLNAKNRTTTIKTKTSKRLLTSSSSAATTTTAATTKINANSKIKLRKFLAETSPPPLYIITPTYRRPEQLAELTRLGYTLKHIVNLLWIVIEDANRTSPLVTQTLNRVGVPYEYLVAPMPEEYKKTKKAKPRGVSNRNRGLQWLRENATEGVFYFADDDNTYDIIIFEQMRYTKKVSMWPVGLVTKYGVSTPIIRNGKIDGFYDGWIGGRKFPVDMAGFAVSVKFLHDRPKAKMPFKPGYEEDGFLKSLAPLNMSEIELLASECTEILTWHTQTKKNPAAERLNTTKYGNTNLASIDKILVRP